MKLTSPPNRWSIRQWIFECTCRGYLKRCVNSIVFSCFHSCVQPGWHICPLLYRIVRPFEPYALCKRLAVPAGLWVRLPIFILVAEQGRPATGTSQIQWKPFSCFTLNRQTLNIRSWNCLCSVVWEPCNWLIHWGQPTSEEMSIAGLKFQPRTSDRSAGAPQETKSGSYIYWGDAASFHDWKFRTEPGIRLHKPNRNRIPLKDLWTLPLHRLNLVESLLKIFFFLLNMRHHPNLLLHRRQLLPRNQLPHMVSKRPLLIGAFWRTRLYRGLKVMLFCWQEMLDWKPSHNLVD